MRRTLPISLLVTALFLSGCAADEQDRPAPSTGDERAVGHIHGLGVDPADDTLYVATHHGLFHVDQYGEPRRVADRDNPAESLPTESASGVRRSPCRPPGSEVVR